MTKSVFICLSAFLISCFTGAGFADEHFPFLAEVSKESVNVRAGPNTNFQKVDKLSKGTRVVVLGRSYEWFKVQPLPSTKAYIRSDYLKKQGDIAVVVGDNVNVRCSPTSESTSLGEVKQGTTVRVLGEENGWSLLAPVPGTAAWIHQDFLQEISSQVPSSMLIGQIQWPAMAERKVAVTGKIINESVSLQGVLQALPAAEAGDDVHYKMVIGNAVYYLQDIPQMSFFANSVVTVEGTVIPNPPEKLAYPLLHINKIALVL